MSITLSQVFEKWVAWCNMYSTKYDNDDIAGKMAKYDEKRQNHEPFK
jgi:hypothetical protein